MKKRIYLFSLLGCLMMVGYLFTACSGSVENTPESVAAFAVKAYQKGNFADLKEYSTEDLQKKLESETEEDREFMTKMFEGAKVELDNVSDYAADGSIKTVSFNMQKGERSSTVRVRMANEEGKWLFDGLKFY